MIREIAELKNMIKGLSLQNNTQRVKACGICADHFHPTNACPQLQNNTLAEVHAVGGYGPPRPRSDNQAQNNYNPRWRDQAEWQPQYQPQYQPRHPAPQANASPSMEDMLKTLTQYFTTHVQTTESSLRNMEKQINQLAQTVTHLAQKNTNSLPAQAEVDSQVRNVSAITLRNGKYLGESPLAEKGRIAEEGVTGENTRPLGETHARASSREQTSLSSREQAVTNPEDNSRSREQRHVRAPADTSDIVFAPEQGGPSGTTQDKEDTKTEGTSHLGKRIMSGQIFHLSAQRNLPHLFPKLSRTQGLQLMTRKYLRHLASVR